MDYSGIKDIIMLTQQESDIITFFENGATIAEIAEALNLPWLQTSELLFAALKKLAYGNTAKLRKPFYAAGFPFDRERVPKGGYRQ